MREIEFRGKRTNNGEWVYGYFENNKFQNIIHSIEEPFRRSYYINPKSLGQYTGLKDKNGRKIYEGDIIKHNGWLLSLIEFEEEDAGFKLHNKTMGKMHPSKQFFSEHCEVIGNIYEHPELLKS